MKIISFISILSGFSLAFPNLQPLVSERDDHPYIPKQPGDLRSPCPGTNTLANHGYINRDGRNITKDQYTTAFLDAFGMALEVIIGLANTTMIICQNLTGSAEPCDAFNLDMLDVPHNLEHDASITRPDRNETWNEENDNHTFNETIWQKTLDVFGGATHIDQDMSFTAIHARIAQQQAVDTPGWFDISDANFLGILLEHGFILTTMNDPEVNPDLDPLKMEARLDWVNHWFQQEELPTALGWVKPPTISLSYIKEVFDRVSTGTSVPPSSGAFTPDPTALATLKRRKAEDVVATALAFPTPTGIL